MKFRVKPKRKKNPADLSCGVLDCERANPSNWMLPGRRLPDEGAELDRVDVLGKHPSLALLVTDKYIKQILNI